CLCCYLDDIKVISHASRENRRSTRGAIQWAARHGCPFAGLRIKPAGDGQAQELLLRVSALPGPSSADLGSAQLGCAPFDSGGNKHFSDNNLFREPPGGSCCALIRPSAGAILLTL